MVKLPVRERDRGQIEFLFQPACVDRDGKTTYFAPVTGTLREGPGPQTPFGPGGPPGGFPPGGGAGPPGFGSGQGPPGGMPQPPQPPKGPFGSGLGPPGGLPGRPGLPPPVPGGAGP